MKVLTAEETKGALTSLAAPGAASATSLPFSAIHSAACSPSCASRSVLIVEARWGGEVSIMSHLDGGSRRCLDELSSLVGDGGQTGSQVLWCDGLLDEDKAGQGYALDGVHGRETLTSLISSEDFERGVFFREFR